MMEPHGQRDDAARHGIRFTDNTLGEQYADEMTRTVTRADLPHRRPDDDAWKLLDRMPQYAHVVLAFPDATAGNGGDRLLDALLGMVGADDLPHIEENLSPDRPDDQSDSQSDNQTGATEPPRLIARYIDAMDRLGRTFAEGHRVDLALRVYDHLAICASSLAHAGVNMFSGHYGRMLIGCCAPFYLAAGRRRSLLQALDRYRQAAKERTAPGERIVLTAQDFEYALQAIRMAAMPLRADHDTAGGKACGASYGGHSGSPSLGPGMVRDIAALMDRCIIDSVEYGGDNLLRVGIIHAASAWAGGNVPGAVNGLTAIIAPLLPSNELIESALRHDSDSSSMDPGAMDPSATEPGTADPVPAMEFQCMRVWATRMYLYLARSVPVPEVTAQYIAGLLTSLDMDRMLGNVVAEDMIDTPAGEWACRTLYDTVGAWIDIAEHWYDQYGGTFAEQLCQRIITSVPRWNEIIASSDARPSFIAGRILDAIGMAVPRAEACLARLRIDQGRFGDAQLLYAQAANAVEAYADRIAADGGSGGLYDLVPDHAKLLTDYADMLSRCGEAPHVVEHVAQQTIDLYQARHKETGGYGLQLSRLYLVLADAARRRHLPEKAELLSEQANAYLQQSRG